MNRYTVELSDRKRRRLVTVPFPEDAVEAVMGSRLRHLRLDATFDGGTLQVFECTTTDLAKVRAYVRIREDS